MQEVEIWLPVHDRRYSGVYHVSNLGRVKSVARSTMQKPGQWQQRKEVFLKFAQNKLGYPTVTLHDEMGHMKTWRVHRLVAFSHVANPNKYSIVNHIDGNKLNARADNLEWCEQSDNLFHACRTGLNKGKTGHTGGKNSLSKAVGQYDLSGNLIKIWPGTRDAERNGGFKSAQISAVATGRKKTHKGFIWKYCES